MDPILESRDGRLGQVCVSFFEKRVFPLKTTSKAPMWGKMTYLLVLESMYLFSAILKGMRWEGTILPTISSWGMRCASISVTESFFTYA